MNRAELSVHGYPNSRLEDITKPIQLTLSSYGE